MYRLDPGEGPDTRPKPGRLDRTEGHRCFQALATHIGKCQAERDVRLGESRKLAGMVLRIVHGLIHLERGGHMRDNMETSAPEEIVELLLALFARA